ncbi:hypothetical protein GCM10028857_11080 [Salinarchaeum chitinilyticum]
MAAIGDHVRSDGTAVSPGVYRVVGTGDEVTLLRVADPDGRRRHTGELIHVSVAALDTDFEPTADPDAGIAPRARIRNAVQGLYWSVRRFF